MIQYFEVRLKTDFPVELTAEAVQERLGYEIQPPVSIVSVTEDVQARGMGESLADGATLTDDYAAGTWDQVKGEEEDDDA
jgi:hypothetical protein